MCPGAGVSPDSVWICFNTSLLLPHGGKGQYLVLVIELMSTLYTCTQNIQCCFTFFCESRIECFLCFFRNGIIHVLHGQYD